MRFEELAGQRLVSKEKLETADTAGVQAHPERVSLPPHALLRALRRQHIQRWLAVLCG